MSIDFPMLLCDIKMWAWWIPRYKLFLWISVNISFVEHENSWWLILLWRKGFATSFNLTLRKLHTDQFSSCFGCGRDKNSLKVKNEIHPNYWRRNSMLILISFSETFRRPIMVTESQRNDEARNWGNYFYHLFHQSRRKLRCRKCLEFSRRNVL